MNQGAELPVVATQRVPL